MTTQPQLPSSRPRLGDVLVSANVITKEQLAQALREQSSWGGRLGQNLLALGFVDEVRLAAAIAAHLGLPSVDLDKARLPKDVGRLLPLELCERFGMLPLGHRPQEAKLLLACFDPTNTEAQVAARRASGLNPMVHVATASSIDRAIRRYYYGENAPTPSPGSPLFTVTRNTMEAAQAAAHDRDLLVRFDELERRVERLQTLVEDLAHRLPGG
jgi:type IV pilus assembly protein PilB